jgi:asparagine synthetase B (glutamine-hydrolysing)
MLIAVWWSDHEVLPESFDAQLNALLDEAPTVRFDVGHGLLAVRSPAELRRTQEGAVAWAIRTDGKGPQPGLPTVSLDRAGLVLTAPALPQYPLYYAIGPGGRFIVACSRMEPLSRILPRAAVRAHRLVSMIQTGGSSLDPDRGATIYEGVRRLLPGESLRGIADGVEVDRALPRLPSSYRRGRAEGLATELRAQLSAAVGRAIGASRCVTVLASGGLDSSGILALALERARGLGNVDVRALSLQFRTRGEDREYFDDLIDRVEVTPVRISAADAAPWFLPSLVPDAQPAMGSAMCIEMLFYASGAKCGADVTLCGSAGDGVLGGPLPFAQLVRRGRVFAAVGGALRIRLPWAMTPLGRIRTFLVRPFLPTFVLRAKRRASAPEPWMTRKYRDLLEECWSHDEQARVPDADSPDAWMKEMCDGPRYVLPDIADVGGQALAATQGAAFDVFMDEDLVRFVLEIDPVELSHNHEYRGLYRLAMKDALPKSILRRHDKAYFPPAVAAAALSANALDRLSDLSSLDALADRGLVDPSGFCGLFRRWLAAVRRGERNEVDPGDERWEQVWQLLSSEAFFREHGGARPLA